MIKRNNFKQKIKDLSAFLEWNAFRQKEYYFPFASIHFAKYLVLCNV